MVVAADQILVLVEWVFIILLFGLLMRLLEVVLETI
jgi:hypothetical protein